MGVLGLQFSRIRFHRRHSRNTHGRALRRYLRDPVWNLSKGTPQLCRQSWLLQLHRWIGHHCSQRSRAIFSSFDPGHEEVGHHTGLP